MKKMLFALSLLLALTACTQTEQPNEPDVNDIDGDESVFSEPSTPDPVPVEPIEPEPVPVEPVEPEPVPVEPIESEPVPVEPLEPDSQVETVKLRGAALDSVDTTDFSDEYRYMSFDEAQSLTGGELHLLKENHKEHWDGYLTPSGKLVYMYPSVFEQLPEGTVDFAVDWNHPENSVAPVNFRTVDYRTPDGLISLEASNIVFSDIKYDLYVDVCSSMDAYDPYEVFCCYGVAMEGTVSYDYGFKVDSEDYKGMTLKCTVTDPKGNIKEYSGSTDNLVSVESRVRDVASIDWLTWNVVAEIIDSDGNVVYTESFMYNEYEDFANSIEFAIPMQ